MFKKLFTAFVLIIISSLVCVAILVEAKTKLEPFFVRASENVSDEAIFKVLNDNYEDAYYPYKNLAYLINDYESIEHIYKLEFTQKLPLYAYVIQERDYTTPVTFLIVFNSVGGIDNIIFLKQYSSLYDSSYMKNKNIADVFEGQKAPNINTDSIASVTPSAIFIQNAIENAAKHFTYEVKLK